MKVLGVGEDKYICEVTDEEMYILVNGDYNQELEVSAGDEIDLQRVIKAAKWIRDLDTEHVDRVIKELQMALIGVEKVKTTATALNLFNKLKDKDLT